MRLRPALLVGYYATVLAVMGLIVLAGIAHRARHPSPDSPPDAPKRLEAASEPLPAPPGPEQPSLPPTPVASPTPLTTPDPPHVAPRPVQRPVPASSGQARALAITPGAPVVGTTLATHYASRPPVICWDPAPHLVPRSPYFVAMRSMPCGTRVIVTGPLGSVEATVEDHGPNCGCPERGIDASDEVFRETVGPLSIGVASVSWAPG